MHKCAFIPFPICDSFLSFLQPIVEFYSVSLLYILNIFPVFSRSTTIISTLGSMLTCTTGPLSQLQVKSSRVQLALLNPSSSSGSGPAWVSLPMTLIKVNIVHCHEHYHLLFIWKKNLRKKNFKVSSLWAREHPPSWLQNVLN